MIYSGWLSPGYSGQESVPEIQPSQQHFWVSSALKVELLIWKDITYNEYQITSKQKKKTKMKKQKKKNILSTSRDFARVLVHKINKL